MSTVYYLVNESDYAQIAHMDWIGSLLNTYCESLFEDISETEFIEQKKEEVQNAISNILCRAEAPATDICAITRSGVHWREFGGLEALKQHLTDEKSASEKFVILDEYNNIVPIDKFEEIVVKYSE